MSSNRFNIVPIVEGHGEVDAVPILLNRWFAHRNFKNFGTPRSAVRAPKSSIIAPLNEEREIGIELYIRRAIMQIPKPDGILVLIDSDDECIARKHLPGDQQIGPELLRRAVTEASHIPIGVVLANREFEAWYLAAHRRLKARGQFVVGERFPSGFDFENPRDCKGRVEKCLGRRYSETADQKELVKHLGFGSYMGKYCRSFNKLLRDLERIALTARRNRKLARRREHRESLES
jgi:hypothetical protein